MLTGSKSYFMPRSHEDKLHFQLKAFKFHQDDRNLVSASQGKGVDVWDTKISILFALIMRCHKLIIKAQFFFLCVNDTN